ncbi:MAG TPA: (2Fe-2S)-binding protein [Acidimicrobiales bacterium]|nr:(2Fe-2S)-binding protein [Acidimicrobiales bacterium]
MNVKMTLNGEPFSAETPSDGLLVDVLRLNGFTGTKEGCGVGVCGACTVLVSDVPVASCIYLAALAEGQDVWTVEGLTEKDSALLNAFVEKEGMQCGICTPGQVVSAYALGIENPTANEEEIREFMAGNLCRCTGYVTITESVRAYLASK